MADAPSHAAACRALLREARTAALATHAVDPASFPFASLVAVADDGQGRPLLLLSSLAEHTRNLKQRPEVSLLLAPHGSEDPLAGPRVTLLGRCEPVPPSEAPAALERFLLRHPEARVYAGFADFALFRVEPSALRFVGGFGRMSWVEVQAYLAEGREAPFCPEVP